MSETLKLTVDRRDKLAVIYTEGYINNQGGEQIAREAFKLIDAGEKTLLLNLSGTKIVNAIGISRLIEIIEKMLEIEGRLAFCSLTPTIEKTFHIMGLTQYASIFPDEERAVGDHGPLGRGRGDADGSGDAVHEDLQTIGTQVTEALRTSTRPASVGLEDDCAHILGGCP